MHASLLTQVEGLVEQLTIEERLILVERLAHQLHEILQAQRKPQDLFGIWKDKFPSNIDLDLALSEVRSEWQKEWDEDEL